MSAASSLTIWFPLLALLAAEVGVVALLVELLRRGSSSAAWRRTFCQAGLVAMLVLSVGEMSGVARSIAAWAVAPASSRAQEKTRLTVGDATRPIGNVSSRGGTMAEDGWQSRFVPTVPLSGREREGQVIHPPTQQNLGAPTGGTAALSQAGLASQAGLPMDSINSAKAPVQPVKLPGPNGGPTGEGRAAVQAGGAARLSAGFWLVLVWGAGALLVGGRMGLARGVFVLVRLRRQAVGNRAVVERAQHLARALGLRRRVRLLAASRLASPFAFGWIWPSVALPADFGTQWDGAKQGAVLAHELAHLAARDPFWSLVADTASMILWWHPAVWWLRRQLQLASELAADEASLLVADGPRVLAECLVELGARLLHRPAAGQLPVAGLRSHLGRRVEMLLCLEGRAWSPPRRLPAALARSFGPAALAAAVVLCTAWAAPRQFTKGDSMKTIQQNWKQSLAAFALLAAAHAPDAVAREAQTQPPTPAAKPEAARAAPALARAPDAGPALVPSTASQIEAKLKSIVLREVGPWDNLPLSEVVKLLNEQARRLDPERIGVNFMMDYKTPAGSGPAPLDPATGLPVAGFPVEAIDLNTIGIKIVPALHNVTMRDVLDAMLKAADRPIQYTIEEYAVLFSFKPATNLPLPLALGAPAPGRLSARTFKVDTNTVAAALETTFDVSVNNAGGAANRSRAIQQALESLFIQRLGLTLRDNALFFNGLTGVLMVRATPDDLEVVAAAMETLTGLERKADPFQARPPGGARFVDPIVDPRIQRLRPTQTTPLLNQPEK